MNQYNELKGFRQIVFALGHIGPGMLNQFITTWLLLYLTEGENILVKSSLVGVSLMLGRIVDAVSDPLVANWSDRLSGHKWGRRLPFIVLGTPVMILSFVLLWYTQVFSSAPLRFLWVLVWVNVFYFAYTVVVNPYFALLPEIASGKKQRMFIQSFVAFFGILGMGIAMGASGFLVDAIGYGAAGMVMSLICVLTLIGPVVTVRVNPHAPKISEDKTPDANFFVSLKGALENENFRNYIFGFCIFYLGFQLIQYNLAFITTVLLSLDKGMSSTLFIVSVLAAVLLIPVYNLLLKKLSCSSALKLAIGAYVVVALLIAGIPLWIRLGISARPLGFGLMILLGFPYSGLMVIPNVIVSEIIDDDVRVNGVHREALFFGVQGLINKFMVALAALIVSVMLDVFGNNASQPFGVIAVAPLAAVVAGIGFLFIRRLHLPKGGQK